MNYKPHYTTGLGKKSLRRAQIVFIVVVLLLLTTTGSAVYAGMKSGELERTIIQPVKQMATNIKESLAAIEDASEISNYDDSYEYSATSSSKTTIEINNGTETQSGSGYRVTYPQQPAVDYNAAYEKARAEQEAWWNQVQEENRMLSEESKRQLDQFKADSDKRMEEARQEGQAGMEAFSAEQKAKQQAELEAWKKEHGIN